MLLRSIVSKKYIRQKREVYKSGCMNVTAIILLIETIVCLIPTAWFFISAFKKTRHASYVIMSTGMTLICLANITGGLAWGMPSNLTLEHTVFILFGITNTLISLGFLFLINSLIRIRFGRLSSWTHIPTILVGALITLFWDSDNKIVYTSEFQLWSVQYSTEASIVTGLVALTFIVEFLIYFVLKIKNHSHRMSNLVSGIAMIIVLFWAFTVSINNIFVYRAFLLNIALLLLGIAIARDPLCLLVTKNSISRAILFYSTVNKPVFQYNFITDTVESNVGDLNQLIAVELVLRDYIQKYEEELKGVAFTSTEIIKVDYKDWSIIGIGTKLDINIRAALHYLLVHIHSLIDYDRFQRDFILTEREEKQIIENLKQVVESIVVK